MGNKLTPLILALFGVIALGSITALTVLHDPVPAILEFVATGTLSALAGISVPTLFNAVTQQVAPTEPAKPVTQPTMTPQSVAETLPVLPVAPVAASAPAASSAPATS